MYIKSKKFILPDRWTPLRYHEKQAQAWRSKARFVNLACGRRSGKTELARRKIVMELTKKKPWKNPIYFYALPTFAQGKKVAWKELLNLIPASWIVEKNIQDMYIETIFGSQLYVVGMDQPQRIEGLGYDGGIIDEACDHKPGSFELSIRPALSDREGWCWRIGVPKRVGIGAAEFKKVFEQGFDSRYPDIESYSWKSIDIMDESEILAAKRSMDEKNFREQYEASWEQAGGLIFHVFDEKIHVNDEICKYRPNLPIIVGMDFNVDPMAWVIGQIIPDFKDPKTGERRKTLIILDELFISNTNTPQCLEELGNRLDRINQGKPHKERVIFYGDAASRARKTSASTTDYLHIANFNRIDRSKKKILIPNSNPPILDRFSVTNTALKNADDQISCYVHSRCRHLIIDLNYRAYKPETSIPNDEGEIGHITDALGYIMWIEFPPKIDDQDTPSIGIYPFAG